MNENDQILDHNGQVLNEEGLPFIDVTETIPEEDNNLGRGVVQAFRPEEEKSKEERKRWMNSILDQLEEEEEGGGGGEEDGKAIRVNNHSSQVEPSSKRPSHDRVSSADRPLPAKSVLKHTSHIVSPDPKFGASGMRKGFLNMNPSSPAAEHSSDPIEKVRWPVADENMSASTSSLGSMIDQITNGDERMSRSMDLGEKAKKKEKNKKKSVRIQSPEGLRKDKSQREELVGPIRETRQVSRDIEDEGNEEEAKMIVELLGIDAIKGHPQYESIKQEMNTQQKEAERSAEQANANYQSIDRSTDGLPSMRKEVIERLPNEDPPVRLSNAKRNSQALKKGFLNVKPRQTTKPLLSPLPSAPKTTQGIPALERANNRDEIISEERIKQGLSPYVPHARPSKAFAEKIEARKRGERTSNQPEESDSKFDQPSKTSKVRFGESKDDEIQVKIGTAATKATNAYRDDQMSGILGDGNSDEDDVMAELGLEVYDEELDEDQVDALGYFSDEDVDPDIGFDSDDMVEAIVPPQFDSDVGELNNEELRQEYERIKANLAQQDAFRSSSLSQGEGSREGVMETNGLTEVQDGQDLSLIDENFDRDAKFSRFRRERLHRAMAGKKASSRELGTGSTSLQSAQDVGPSMLIPTLANIRFPKQKEDGRIPTSAHEIELDGQSDEEEDRLEDVMRARLEQRKFNEMQGNVQQSTSENKPPEIITQRSEQEPIPKNAKKASLFKARMQERG